MERLVIAVMITACHKETRKVSFSIFTFSSIVFSLLFTCKEKKIQLFKCKCFLQCSQILQKVVWGFCLFCFVLDKFLKKFVAFEKFQRIVSRKSCLWHRTTKPHEVIKTLTVPVSSCLLIFVLLQSRSSGFSIVKNVNGFCYCQEFFCISFASVISRSQKLLIASYAAHMLRIVSLKYLEPRRVTATFLKLGCGKGDLFTQLHRPESDGIVHFFSSFTVAANDKRITAVCFIHLYLVSMSISIIVGPLVC